MVKSGHITHHIEKCLKISKGGALTPTGTATICQIFLTKKAIRFDCQKSIRAYYKNIKKIVQLSNTLSASNFVMILILYRF